MTTNMEKGPIHKFRPTENCVSDTVNMTETGGLHAESYDFSDAANDWFGNDIAYTLDLTAEQLPELARQLKAGKSDDLAATVAERFDRFDAFKTWLEEQEIPHQSAFDRWA